MALNAIDSDEPIKVIINSPGGIIKSGMLMYDVIQSSPAPIVLYCAGEAYSMAAILFACGKHGRYMLPNSKLMVHEPLVQELHGNCSSIKSASESLIKTKKELVELLEKHTGKSAKFLKKLMENETFMNAEESVTNGLCDSVVEFSELLK